MKTGNTLYIGCTRRSLESRLSQHRTCSKNGITILSQHIRDDKVILGIRELDSIRTKNHSNALTLEKKWIKKLASEGVDLLNHVHAGKINPLALYNRSQRKIINAN